MNDIKILYVDDEILNLMSFESEYKRDFKVYTAKNENECMEVLKNNEISIIISDHRMPRITGVELLSLVKEKFPGIKRIILSGYIDDVQIQDGIKNNIIDMAFEKPFERFYLEEIVNYS